MIVFGYDPGGAGANGVATLTFQSGVVQLQTATCECVDEAVDWFRSQAGEEPPHGVGIDTLLSWGTGRAGWRPMDIHLRRQYPEVQHSVLSSNSASGSFVVQGVALAIRVMQTWGKYLIPRNETHPKVLYHALTRRRYQFGPDMIAWLASQFDPRFELVIKNEHEWDAAISAWATWKGLSGQWNTDLMDLANNLVYPVGEVTYYWFESLV